MNINKYTEKAQEAVLGAQQLADREGHPEITPEHLLLTLIEQRDGIVPEIVRKLNADPAALATAVRGELTRQPRAHGGTQVGLPPRLRRVTDTGSAERPLNVVLVVMESLSSEFVSCMEGPPGTTPTRSV